MTLPIPKASLSQHSIALGKTRSGKSSKVRVLVEWLLNQHKPVTIIDVKGDWWGLKSAADGRSAGYPIVIFGGKHADVPLNARAGAAVAELTSTGNRPSLLDLRGWMPHDKTRFFIDFASKTFELTQGERYLVMPEVHNFAPKGKVMSPEAGEMLHWANRLASEGQGLGLILLADSQRPQKVHNDFLTSCETLIACRVIHKADRDAIKDWIDGCADPAVGKQMLGELAGMSRSDAWCWSPEIGFGPEKITWPLFKTYDSFKPQQANTTKLAGWAQVDLEEVRAKLQSVVADAEANDPKMLRKRIADLEQQLKASGDSIPPREVARLRPEALVEVRNQFEHARTIDLQRLSLAIEAAAEKFRGAMSKLKDEAARWPVPHITIGGNTSVARTPAPANALKAAAANHQVPARARASSGSSETLPIGEAKILAALIQFPEGRTRPQLTVLTGYTASSLQTYLPRLSARGYVDSRGQTVRATHEGQAALPDVEPLPTGKLLRDHWLSHLPQGERKILETLIEAYPKGVDRESLSKATGYTGSSLQTYLPRLSAKSLATTSGGETIASEDLFS